MSILQDIYNGEYFPTENQDKLSSEQRTCERAFWDAVEAAKGKKFTKFHRKRFRSREKFQNYASFREGFRLGVALVMEFRQ